MRFVILILLQIPIICWAQTWSNSGKPAQLIQLFTSQGCSSCPPADQYLSSFASEPRLWLDKIPAAYHVDYWDYIGWKDRYAQPAFTQKQRLFHSYGVLSSVYTPSFVVDGMEWRGFFYRRSKQLPAREVNSAGKLTLTLDGSSYRLSYEGSKEYIATLVFLALDEKTEVNKGENQGRVLSHDFVVIQEQQRQGKQQWQFSNSTDNRIDAVAAWIRRPTEFKPTQTVAGMINF
ncbi:DUF1223 domain-containing protein [Vibrio gallicus]|uniref:DUF1223 domain-containing protein n=1 Tax=Vibrio gallicus TaxID=190897 RepID=UPI0021C27353|nr:DUF1223 domain-containing protein [Vibrio gallicus]